MFLEIVNGGCQYANGNYTRSVNRYLVLYRDSYTGNYWHTKSKSNQTTFNKINSKFI